MKKLILITVVLFISACCALGAEDPNSLTLEERQAKLQFSLDCIPELIEGCRTDSIDPNSACIPDYATIYPDPNDPNSLGDLTVSKYLAVQAMFGMFDDLNGICADANVPGKTEAYVKSTVFNKIINALMRILLDV